MKTMVCDTVIDECKGKNELKKIEIIWFDKSFK